LRREKEGAITANFPILCPSINSNPHLAFALAGGSAWRAGLALEGVHWSSGGPCLSLPETAAAWYQGIT
jgi:hypothetical protein